jgi:hypothetical protein
MFLKYFGLNFDVNVNKTFMIHNDPIKLVQIQECSKQIAQEVTLDMFPHKCSCNAVSTADVHPA